MCARQQQRLAVARTCIKSETCFSTGRVARQANLTPTQQTLGAAKRRLTSQCSLPDPSPAHAHSLRCCDVLLRARLAVWPRSGPTCLVMRWQAGDHPLQESEGSGRQYSSGSVDFNRFARLQHWSPSPSVGVNASERIQSLWPFSWQTCWKCPPVCRSNSRMLLSTLPIANSNLGAHQTIRELHASVL